jgi:hypothetical protein
MPSNASDSDIEVRVNDYLIEVKKNDVNINVNDGASLLARRSRCASAEPPGAEAR